MTRLLRLAAAAGILITAGGCGPNDGEATYEDDPASTAPDVTESTTPPSLPPGAGGVTEQDSSGVVLER